MTPLDSVVENRLRQASRRWKSLLFLQRSSTLGAVVLLVILLLGAGNVVGVVSGTLATIVMVLTGIVAAFSWLVMTVGIRASTADRKQLARALDGVQPPLLDRLNTLVALERERDDPAVRPYFRRIETQAHNVMRGTQPPNPFSVRRPLAHLLVFLLLLCATRSFYKRFEPFKPVTPTPPPAAPTPTCSAS